MTGSLIGASPALVYAGHGVYALLVTAMGEPIRSDRGGLSAIRWPG